MAWVFSSSCISYILDTAGSTALDLSPHRVERCHPRILGRALISQRQGGIAHPPCWAQAFQKGQGGGQQGRAVALRVRAVGMHRALPWAGDEPVKSLLSLMISLSFCNSVLSGKKISLKKINHRVTH